MHGKCLTSSRTCTAFPSTSRLLLEVASILHEVGSFISQQDHQLHSQYIILNSEIFGLSRDDVETIALLARYHRHEVPANSDPMYGELELTDRMRVAKMAAILRVADAGTRPCPARERRPGAHPGPDAGAGAPGRA